MIDSFKTKLKSGDKSSWSHLFSEHIDILYRYGIRIIQEEEILKDCIQDVFLSLYERRESIEGIENVRAYLLRALRNKLINYHKSNRFSMIPICEKSIEVGEESIHILELSGAKIEQKRAIKQMLCTLTEREREFILLRFYKGLSHEAISVLCGIKKQTVSNAIHKALKNLQARFKNNE